MVVKIGERLVSAVCDTQIIIVRPPAHVEAELTCGGAIMVDAASAPTAAAKPGDEVTLSALGKRYEDGVSGIEVLCTKGGGFIPEIDGRPLQLKDAKPLPASD